MPAPPTAEHRLAAIDIGSNSCLLEIGRMEGARVVLYSHRKEAIRLGSALDSQGQLGLEAMQRGWDCLERYAQLLGDLPRSHVRVVATQTLREATNKAVFLERGSAILGAPIEVIDGEQEARLIYRGVAQSLPTGGPRRLVMDIGGRSTELCLGRGLQATHALSFAVGSQTWAQQFFADGSLSAQAFARAQDAAMAAIAPQAPELIAQGWEHAYGASGTAGAIVKALAHEGQPAGWIDVQGLDWLHAQLLRAGHASRVDMGGLKEEQRPMIGGGLSVMRALFRCLGLKKLRVTHGALRHGVLYTLAEQLQQRQRAR